jgi:hypothetical protein
MPLPITNLSLDAIHVEVGGTSGTTVSLNDADVRNIGAPDSTYDGGDGINTTSGTTISIGEFRNASDISATTYYSSISAESYSSDSAVIASADLQVFYSSGNIDVRLSAGDSSTPVNDSIVYRISNAPSGYTVKRGTLTVNADDSPDITGTSIGTSATSIPTASSYVDVEYKVDSGGGYDDPGDAHSNFSSSLIFEKSGATTFTYSFTIDLQAENAGEGGQ